MVHYGLRASHNSPSRAHENGDIEQSHYRFKRAVAEALKLRGSRDFATRADYDQFYESYCNSATVCAASS